MTEKEKDLVIGDMSMLLRMMVTKFRRGKLDDEYCDKVLDYLVRKGLQGNILRALELN
jgi:dihydrodipicolinate synthase/N-acetylneuraminate lyase